MDGVGFCPFCEAILLSRLCGRMAGFVAQDANADVGSVQSTDAGRVFADVGMHNLLHDRL